MSASHALRIAPGQRFRCHSCTRCCRGWHVALSEAEITRLRQLKWPDDPHVPAAVDPVIYIRGRPYLAHRPNGDCIYLDPATRLCRLHTRFGQQAKPFGCRLFPYDPSMVLPGVLAIGTRFDCPSVQRNQGDLLTDQRDALRRLARERTWPAAPPPGGIDPQVAILLAESFADVATEDPATGVACATLAVAVAADQVARVEADLLNRPESARTFLPSFHAQWRDRAAALLSAAPRPGHADRVLFRLWLANHLRRDEEILGQSILRRVRRPWDAAAIVAGHGNLHRLGREHPSFPLARLRLLGAREPLPIAADARECWDRFLAGRLRTLRFFGPSFGNVGIFRGAKRLAALLPLVVAAATVHAAADGRTGQLAAADLQYGVGAIDHAYGRSPLLHQGAVASGPDRFGDPHALASLLRGLGL